MEATLLGQDEAKNRILQLLGCKWSVLILDSLRESGRSRPADLCRRHEGLASRVLHRCLNRMILDGLIERFTFDEIPPHTEYDLTPQGVRLLSLLESVRSLASDWTGGQAMLTQAELEAEDSLAALDS